MGYILLDAILKCETHSISSEAEGGGGYQICLTFQSNFAASSIQLHLNFESTTKWCPVRGYLEVIRTSFAVNLRTIHGCLYLAAQVSTDHLCGRSAEKSKLLVAHTVYTTQL